jgi:hypothetical protein
MWRAGHICLLALAASTLLLSPTIVRAERVYYEVNGHRYWYNPNSKRGKERAAQELAAKELAATEAAKGARIAQQDETPFRKLMNFFGASSVNQQPADVAPNDTRQTARPATERRLSRTLDDTGQIVTGTISQSVKPSAPNQAANGRPAQTPAVDAQAMVATPIAWATSLPVPPGPPVIKTITYDFAQGIKHTRLTDGRIYEEAFDPKAFYAGRAQGPYEP